MKAVSDRLEHLDGNKLVVLALELTVILLEQRHAVLETLTANAVDRILVLLIRNGRRGDMAPVGLCRVDGETAPARPDLQQPVAVRQLQLAAQAIQLRFLCLVEAHVRALENRRGVLHTLVEP